MYGAAVATWEYALLQRWDAVDHLWHAEAAGVRTEDLEEAIRRLGHAGWEMCGVVPRATPFNEPEFHFKRPVG